MAELPAGWPLATGEMAERFRTLPWAQSPLGPVEHWPPPLRTTVDVMLSSDVPMLVLWGEPLVQLYNDAYRRLLPPGDDGDLGQPLGAGGQGPSRAADYARVFAGETFARDGPLRPEDESKEDPPRYRLSHSPLRDDSGAVAGVLVSVAPGRGEERALAAAEKEFTRELQHRLRNLLATLRAIARRSASAKTSLEDYIGHLDGRIAALARTHALLGTGAISLEEMVYEELLGQLATEEQIVVEGPPVSLPPQSAQPLGLALHELAVNAVKFGALDAENGRIEVRWTIDRGREPWLTLTWRERGVDMPAARGAKGFGTEMISRQLPYELDGDTLVQFHPDGVEVAIRFPYRKALSSTGQAGPVTRAS